MQQLCSNTHGTAGRTLLLPFRTREASLAHLSAYCLSVDGGSQHSSTHDRSIKVGMGYAPRAPLFTNNRPRRSALSKLARVQCCLYLPVRVAKTL